MAKYSSWDEILKEEYSKDYFIKLEEFLKEEYHQNTVYPPKDKVFRAFELTPYDKVRVVLFGQDPYINEGQAEGLAFSVPNGTKIPPSLRNIFALLKTDLGIDRQETNLDSWARQGILLLNTTLTVRAGNSMSHTGKGWETFTDNIIKAVNNKDTPVLFVLWGSNARQKKKLVTNPIHEVIEGVHPSPLSAYRGFFESQHFKKIQEFMQKNKYKKIDFS